MSDKDNQLEIELDLNEPTEKEPEIEIVEKEEEVKAESQDEIPVIPPEQGIKELRRRLEEEHRLRKEAEHYAQYATQQATKAYEQVGETEFHLVANALETVKRDNDILKTHLRDAMSIGDHEKVAEIQEAMSLNAVRFNQLERGKREMETRPRQPAFNPPPPPPPPVDPVEQIAAAVSPRSASWINANRDKLKDERSIRKMFRAHEDAVDEGYAPRYGRLFPVCGAAHGHCAKCGRPDRVSHVLGGGSHAKKGCSAGCSRYQKRQWNRL